MKVRDIVTILVRDGWRLVRVRGSHHHYRHVSKPGVVTVPGSGNDDLSPGTLRSIYKQAGLGRPTQSREV
ncbi:MAG: type II toxin-antitoxin system HicA family toxin [Gemmatimonadaceae bacterium]